MDRPKKSRSEGKEWNRQEQEEKKKSRNKLKCMGGANKGEHRQGQREKLVLILLAASFWVFTQPLLCSFSVKVSLYPAMTCL